MRIDNILVIGAGGTGSMLINPLVRYLESQSYPGYFVVADGDAYSLSNADRQNFLLENTGANKAEYQIAMAQASVANEAFKEKMSFIPNFLGKKDCEKITEFTLVINCADNLAIRKFVEDRCLKLKNAIHICCGNELNNGQVQVSLRSNGKQIKDSIYKRSPKFNSTNDDRSKMDCQELAKLPSGGQIITANFMAASLALNYVASLFNKVVQQPYVPSGITYFSTFSNRTITEDESGPLLIPEETKTNDRGRRIKT